jgi:metallothionein
MADKLEKCENPACSCTAPKGEDFCGAHCEGMKGKTEVICQCGHQGCRGDALNAPTGSRSYSV